MPKVDEVSYAEMEPGSALFTLGCRFLSPSLLVKPRLFAIADVLS